MASSLARDDEEDNEAVVLWVESGEVGDSKNLENQRRRRNFQYLDGNETIQFRSKWKVHNPKI